MSRPPARGGDQGRPQNRGSNRGSAQRRHATSHKPSNRPQGEDRYPEVGVQARLVAGILLNAALEKRTGLDEEMAKSPARDLSPADRAFARACAMGALRRLGEIDQILGKRLKALPGLPTMTILRIAVAQMLVLETPSFAAVSTAVKLAERDNKTRPYKNLINAVLRGIDRDGFGVTKPEANLPEWLAARWLANYGDEALKGLAEATRFEPPTDISVKPSADRAALAQALEANILEGGTLRTDRRGDVAQWPHFEDGDWWVQDAAAAIPARLLDVQPGQTALDLCAAPGGKTLQLAASGASVVAVDRSESRLKRLRQNFERTRLHAEVVAIPAEDWEDDRQFDAVLLDAPCSATGTYRRNPEALRAARPADIAKLADVQHRLLDVAAQKVKVGGKLVYCVCSLEREEGETQMIAFLRRNTGFKTVAAEPASVGAPLEALTKEGWLRILPGQWEEKGSLDGFFIALLERTA
ncbi:RsmB/NOP family class I SAM-dependent RNA methyltransferase [Brevundimonas terrae]|uniref:RsmB/NOP family class I SAM-dependent RNA methyltransferase n=1 Tax=Brevundimonas terrae TaxID=363631 RepID=A0ABN0Y2E2_9CAUL|nr:RsmB/NOP family class I SAM-dependent RNA methyltransferase [Brevundimonas terrae]NIJ26006.1 16S rRNA (cytosine967-C5)-methyltransferase [Brevundimonas terrae]